MKGSGNQPERKVQSTAVDFSGKLHLNIGSLNRSKSLNSTLHSNTVAILRTPAARRNHLCLFDKSVSTIKKPPRAIWRKGRPTDLTLSISKPLTVDVERETDDIIEIEPPTKKSKMDLKENEKGSCFNASKDIEIVKVVDRSKFLFNPFAALKAKVRRGFGFERQRSTVFSEERREDKRKYAELLQRHIYPGLNRRKPISFTQDKLDLALEVIKSHTPDLKTPKKVPELVDLSEEKKETAVAPTRVLVNHRHSITPVTQATEKPEIVPGHSRFSRPSSLLNSKKDIKYLSADFVPKLKQSHYKTQKSFKEQAENLKKESEICSKRNSAAEKQRHEKRLDDINQTLKEYLKITECFEEEEDVEVIPPLPVLSEQMQRDIDGALARGKPNEVLAEAFNLKIQRRDIHTLAGLNWLNDEVINFYMNLLMDRGKQEKYPSVYAFNTFFYPKLVSGGHSVLKRWTKKVDIFSYDFVLAPVHLGVHWCMAIIDMGKKQVMYFDSMGGRNDQCLKALKQYLSDERMDKKKEKLDISEWEFVCMKDVPQQMNGSDCGMFSCMYAEYTCRRAPISFTQQDMPYFRRKMIYEIIKVKLLC